MRRISVFLGVLAVLLVSAAPSVLGQGDSPMVEWLDDYDAALAEARRTGKPIFLEFRCAP